MNPPPANPVLVELTRGRRVESRHRAALAVASADGRLELAVGAVADPVFARSAIKCIQALPLIETGAADAFGLGARELALACASHSGGVLHTRLVAAWLRRLGLSRAHLRCGAHWPLGEEESRALARSGAAPTPLHNNCSGKHTGFLTAAVHLHESIEDYLSPDHPSQRRWGAALAECCGRDLESAPTGTDGCGIPVIGVGIADLATAMARFGAGGGGSMRAAAARRLREAMAAHPELVAGEGRFDTRLMRCLAPEVLVKTGAEGVHAAILPRRGLGVAIKVDDGAKRAAETLMAAVLRPLVHEGEGRRLLGALADAPLYNHAGTEIGRVRALLAPSGGA